MRYVTWVHFKSDGISVRVNYMHLQSGRHTNVIVLLSSMLSGLVGKALSLLILPQVQRMCLYSVHSSKSARLEEWEQVQLAAMDTVGNHLKDVWAVSIKNIIK